MLALRQVYKVTAESPRLISNSNGLVSPRHLVLVHDISSREYDIDGTIAKLSLYNLKDITLNINGRILSSFLEISHCSNLIVKFNGPVPATTQLDPNITNLKFIFMNGSEPASFVVAPRPMSSPEGIGLAQISVVLGEHGDKAEKVWSMVDSDGRIDMELMVSSEGKISEQYIIEMVKGGKMERWKMGAVEKISGGIPVLNENKVQH